MAAPNEALTEEPHETLRLTKASTYMRPVKRLFALVLWHRPPPKLYQCGWCYEDKPAKAFKYPWFCNVHLPKTYVRKLKRTPVCFECLRTAVAAQVDTLLASRMGCPDCHAVWTMPDICFLLSNEKRLEYGMKLKE